MSKTPFTKADVLLIAMRLMLQKGETTTLEVKNSLRDAGFFAIQDDVSTTMRILADEEGWAVGTSQDNEHRIYSGIAIQNVMKAGIAAVKSSNGNDDDDNGSKNLTSIAATTHIQNPKPGDWEANSPTDNTVLYFSGTLGRDQVRSFYAKQVGIHRNDARARRVK